MDDLVVWLRAQIDEDERKANSKYEMRPGVANIVESDHLPGGVLRVRVDGGPPEIMTDQEYVDAFLQPKPDQRLLREVEAKRKIVEQCEQVIEAELDNGDAVGLSEYALKTLATIYAGRPGYLDKWRP